MSVSLLLDRSGVLLQLGDVEGILVIALPSFIITLICCNSAMILSRHLQSSLGWEALNWVSASFAELWYCSINLLTFACSSKHRKFKEPGLFTGIGVDAANVV